MPRYSTALRSYSPSTSGVTSELGIVWSSSGGHTHDGVESSIIDGEAYSIFDFRPASRTSTIERDNIQTRNRLALRQFIADTIRQDYNIILDPDTIGAANIIGGSITGNNIAANTITTDLLATDAITSLNYSYTSGNFSTAGTFFNLTDGSIVSKQFYIDSSGNAGFSGALSAASGTFSGDISGASGTFTGNLSGSTITGGSISGGTIDIGDSTSFHVDSDGNMWLGDANYASAPFKVSSGGALAATSATVTGTVNATAGYLGSLSYGFNVVSYSNYARLYSNDNTGSGSSRGKVDITSYGDIFLYSTPTSGNHANQSWNTQIVGEYIVIEKTSATAGQRIRLGNTTGNGGTSIEMDYDNNNRVYITCENLNYGYIRLRNSGNTDKITLSGENGDATFARYLNVGSDSSVSGRAYFKYVNDVSTSGVSGSVIIGGDGSGAHIAIDNNEIMAKSSPTAATTLYLNNDGGTVSTGGGITAAGDIDTDGQYYGPYANGAAGVRHRNSGYFTFDYDGSGYCVIRHNDSTVVASIRGTKTFVIPHPSKANKYLVHAAVEGPTADVFYRGESKLKNGECIIVLPDYFEDLTEFEGRTVTLTPIYNGTKTGVLSSSKVIDGRFTVYSTDQIEDGQEFYWRVDAVRKNTSFDVEPDIGSKKLMGDGPYTYLV